MITVLSSFALALPLPPAVQAAPNSSLESRLPVLSWVDVDGDGRDDVLALDAGAARLFRSTASGLTECTQEFGLSGLDTIEAATFVDFDADEHPDLFLVDASGAALLLRNESGLAFFDATAASGIASEGPILQAEWGDIDGDGYPDLTVWTSSEVQVNRNWSGSFKVRRLPLAAPRLHGTGAASFKDLALDEEPEAGASADRNQREAPRRRRAVRNQVLGVSAVAAGRSTFSSAPTHAIATGFPCTKTVLDSATSSCVGASSVPVIGELYPLSLDFNVDAATKRIGIGTLTPGGKLHAVAAGSEAALLAEGRVEVGTGMTPGVTLDVDAKQAGVLNVLASNGTSTMRVLAEELTGNGPQIDFYTFAGTSTATLDAEQGTQGAALHLRTNAGTTTLIHDAETSGAGAFSSWHAADGTKTVEIVAEEAAGNGGQITIENAGGTRTIVLDGDTAAGEAQFELYNSNGTLAALIDTEEGAGNGAEFDLYSFAGANTVTLDAEEGSGGSALHMRTSSGLTTLIHDAEAAGVGSISQWRMADGTATVTIEAEEAAGNGGQITIENRHGTPTIVFDGDTVEPSAQAAFYNSSGTVTALIDSEEGSGNGAQITLYKFDGTPSIVLDAEQGVNGPGYITTEVLEITGGADLVESFETGGVDCPPGSVVTIDPLNPGELTLSNQPYDRRVAGVVSGAGNVRPGLHLGQTGVTSGDTQVALTGRVYVRCSNENGAVRPGDLLTSSSTPGVAMRATDSERAFGAVLGKAMGTLDAETGLVLTLVNLQ